MTIDLHQAAQISAQGVLNSIAAGLVIALFAAGLLRVLGKRNSGTKFAVWFCALLAIVLLPFFSLGSEHSLVGSTSATFNIPGSWAIYFIGAWAAVSCFALLRVGIGIWHLVALRRSCATVEVGDLDPVLQATIGDAQASRRVAICVSGRLQVPTAIGFFRPAVVLPEWTLRELSTAELNTVLLHELAHLRRWDDWTNLAQKLFRAALFFHPAVWWIESKLSVEREMACDEMVLASTDARAYAECLVRLAEKNYMRRGLAMAQAAVHRAGQTAQRLAKILDGNRPAATLVSKPAVGMVVLFAAGCFAAAPHAPRIVAFGDKTAVASVASVSLPAQTSALMRTQPDKFSAKVVPASFVVPTNNELQLGKTARSKAVPKKSVTRIRKPTRQQEERVLHLVRTSAPRPEEQLGTPGATFVVMQTRQQYNQAGPNGMVWTLTVWHVTVIQQDQSPDDPALRPKST